MTRLGVKHSDVKSPRTISRMKISPPISRPIPKTMNPSNPRMKKMKQMPRRRKKAYLAKLLGGSGDVDVDADDGAEKDDFFMSDDDDDDGEDTAKASTKAFKTKRDKQRYGSKSNAGDMEVTFHAGLEEFGARIKKKQKDGKLGAQETVYERQERLRKEKREAKRLAKKNQEEVVCERVR